MKKNPDYDEKSWLKAYQPEEVMLMNEAGKYGGLNFPTWFESAGIFNIFE